MESDDTQALSRQTLTSFGQTTSASDQETKRLGRQKGKCGEQKEIDKDARGNGREWQMSGSD